MNTIYYYKDSRPDRPPRKTKTNGNVNVSMSNISKDKDPSYGLANGWKTHNQYYLKLKHIERRMKN
jgi:hypothetical protein